MKAYSTGAAAVLALASYSLTAWAAPSKKVAEKKPAKVASPPTPAAPDKDKVDAKRIWPADLERIAGRYTFIQVASPGGFWERSVGPDGKETRRQISINEAPAALREKLLNAEIVISDLKSPRRVDASERVSPSKRGLLRYYDEEGLGTLTVRNLPGISGEEEAIDYSGPVLFHIQHQSHSNPSVGGVFLQRVNEESTWGAATLDSATLLANTIPKDEQDEGQTLIANARILRSGVEIFAYVDWSDREATPPRVVQGVVRLMRQADDPAKEEAANSR